MKIKTIIALVSAVVVVSAMHLIAPTRRLVPGLG